MKQVLSAYTIKNEIHIGLGIRYTVRDKITSFFRYGVTKGTSETEMCSFYLLFLVQIIILLRLANTMVEPRRLNSATSWIQTNIIWQEREVYKWKWNIGPINPNGLQWMIKITERITWELTSHLHVKLLHHPLHHSTKSWIIQQCRWRWQPSASVHRQFKLKLSNCLLLLGNVEKYSL